MNQNYVIHMMNYFQKNQNPFFQVGQIEEFSLIIIRNGSYTFDRINDENAKIIENYIKLGIIKEFR